MRSLLCVLLIVAFSVAGSLRMVPVRRRSRFLTRSEGNDGTVEVDETSGPGDGLELTSADNISAWGAESEVVERVLPRLHANAKSLVKWVVRHGGIFDAAIDETNDGWNLRLSDEEGAVDRGLVLLEVPKTLCIHSDPSRMARDDLLKNAKALMNSLSPQHWRARLAIALLSERVRSKSNYRSYLRNLPFEFWGMPVFFSTSEFALMQDFPLMQKTRDRCKFMSEFAESVLLPLQGGPRDPFSGNSADVNAFGWGFASASSRALREQHIRLDDGFDAADERGSVVAAVMVPGIDLAHHSFHPNCEVVETESSYTLRALGPIEPGTELTISYGPLSNDELLADYGFTVADNPHDGMTFSVDGPMFDTARVVMGQSRVQLGATSEEAMRQGARDAVLKMGVSGSRLASIKKGSSASSSGSGSGGGSNKAPLLSFTGYCPWGSGTMGDLRYNENFLSLWQVYWLRCLDLTGPSRNYRMHVHMGSGSGSGSGTPRAGVDGRLLAFLRVLYSPKEQDLLCHGYTPFTLQEQGSMLSSLLEAQVVKTAVGVMGLMLTGYPTDVETDVAMMQSEDEEMLLDSATTAAAAAALNDGGGDSSKSASSALRGMVGPSSYGQGKRYLEGLVEDTTLRDGLSSPGHGQEGLADASLKSGDDKEGQEEDETVPHRTRRVLRNILTSNDDINDRLYREAESASAAALATASGLQAGKEVQDIASAAEAAAEAALSASAEGDSLEAQIVQKLRSELEGAVQEAEAEAEQGEGAAADSDSDGDGDEEAEAEGDGEGEGEVLESAREEAVPLITSSDSATWKPAPVKVHFTIDISEDSYADVGTSKLPPNVRQAMLYRIRKKKGLRRVIEDLGHRYEALRRASIALAAAPPRMGKGGGEKTLPAAIPPLLTADHALADETSKAERTKRITELVSEVAGREASESSRGEKILSAASKLSDKWGAKGVDL